MSCIRHIVLNATRSALVDFGRDKVIDDVLKRLIAAARFEEDEAEILLPTYVDFFRLTLQRGEGALTLFDAADNLAVSMLEKLELETSKSIRLKLLRHFGAVLEFQGAFRTLRFMTRLIRVFSAISASTSLKEEDEEATLVLDYLESFIESMPETRLEDHAEAVLELLFRRLFTLTSLEVKAGDEIRVLIRCIRLVKTKVPLKYQVLCEGLGDVKTNSAFAEAVKEVNRES